MADFPRDRDTDEAHHGERVPRGDPDLGARRCKSCRGLILWTTTEADKAMPVDFAPSVDGNIAIAIETAPGEAGQPARRIWRSRVVRLDEGAAVRRKSHFATCPHAAEHRQAR